MQLVILGLGSNRQYNGMPCITLLKKACESLSVFISGMTLSSVYNTKPMYVENQDDFYNMVLSGYIEDNITAFDLLHRIHKIESLLGRDRSKEIRNGPRSIDIDIEYFAGQTINTPDLQIPHPRIWERGFVLIPLTDILKQDICGISIEDIKKSLLKLDASQIKKYCGPLLI